MFCIQLLSVGLLRVDPPGIFDQYKAFDPLVTECYRDVNLILYTYLFSFLPGFFFISLSWNAPYPPAPLTSFSLCPFHPASGYPLVHLHTLSPTHRTVETTCVVNTPHPPPPPAPPSTPPSPVPRSRPARGWDRLAHCD